MAVGRISGPLLKANLLRQGIDLAFESDLLYLDVTNQRIGVKTDTPTNELEIVGTTKTSSLVSQNVLADTITGSTGDLTLEGANESDKVVIPRVQISTLENDITITGSLTVQGALNLESLFTINDIDINGGTIDNVVIGSATPPVIIGSTITANSEFIGSLTGNVTGDLTGNVSSTGISQFANIDINGGSINDVDIGSENPIRSIDVDNIKIDNNSITSTNTDGVIRIAPNGAGNFQVESDTLRLGAENENVEFTTWGTGDITVSTNSGLDSGNLVIPAGVNQNITIEPNGTGNVVLSADKTVIGKANQAAKLTTQGTGNLVIDTNDGSGSGAITLQYGTNSDIIIDPNGTGRTVAHNLYIDDGSQNRSIQEYIQDISGGQIEGTAGVISVVYDDPSGTTTIDLVETGVASGTYGSTTQIPVFSVDADGRISTASTAAITTTLNLSGDNSSSGNVDLLTDTLNFTAVNALTAEISSNIDGTIDTVTVTADSATTTSRGVASFDPTNFAVTEGNVVGNDITLGTSTLSLGTSTLTLQGLNLLEVDNIQINTNTIVSTNTGGDIALSPNSNIVDVTQSRIANLDDPVNAKDATNKQYVDEVASGLQSLPSATAATTSQLNGTYANGSGTATLTGSVDGAFPTIDGISISVGENVLVKDQSNKYENGSYVLTDAGSASSKWVLTRCDFCNETDEVAGAFEFVTSGDTQESTGWVATVPSDFVIGSTDPTADTSSQFTNKGDIVWAQFSGSGTYTAGTGLEFGVDGRTFNHVNAITPGTIEDSGGTRTLGYSDSFVVPTFSYDGQGHISGIGTASTITMPSDPRGLFSASGDLAYNSSTGEFSVTTYKDADVESYLSGGTGVAFSGGVISIGQPVGTSDNVTFNDISASGDVSVTGSVTGSLLDIDNIRVDSNTISATNTDGDVLLQPDGSGRVREVIGGVEYNLVSARDIGTDPNEVPVNGFLGNLAYIDTDAIPSILIDDNLLIRGSSETNTSSTTQTIVSSFDGSAYGSGKIIVQIHDTVSGERQVSEILLTHDGTNGYLTEYGVVFTGSAPLAVFDVNVTTEGVVQLLGTSASGNSTNYTVTENLIGA